MNMNMKIDGNSHLPCSAIVSKFSASRLRKPMPFSHLTKSSSGRHLHGSAGRFDF